MEVIEAESPGKFQSDLGIDSEAILYVPVVEAATRYARYAWDRLLQERKNPPHVDVRIVELRVTTADTSVMAVFYASVLAFCDAIGLQLDTPPAINPETRTLTLPL